jgi:hypothetical protein
MPGTEMVPKSIKWAAIALDFGTASIDNLIGAMK